MSIHSVSAVSAVLVFSLALSACGNRATTTSASAEGVPVAAEVGTGSGAPGATYNLENAGFAYERSSIWDIFGGNTAEQTVQVNRYLWAASLDVLSFLPVQSVDPFTGVIVTGYGNPPGGGRAYRATVHITDPALDARSLKVSLQSKGGAVNASTARAVEDAILSRARQLRIRDKNL